MRSKFKWIFTLLLAFSMQFSFAQQKTVTGIVKAATDGLPLPGVNVVVKGTSNGTMTDIDGKYSISASAGQTLEFSLMGMRTFTQAVGASNTVNVSMQDDVAALEEVVVTAYGTQKKSAVTGSIAEIKSEEVAKITTGNVLQGTVGKVAGVQVFNNSGMPGDGPTIRIRGIGSLNASAAPLYVVDGVPFSGDIGMLNAQDIETMTFLKDASAAALYGNRGANGVIILTTKKGKNKKTTITLDSKAGFATRGTKEYNIMTGQKEYYEQYFQSEKNRFIFFGGQSDSQAANSAAAGLITGGDNSLNYNAYNVPNDQLIDPATGQLNPNATLKYDENFSDFLFGNGMFTQTHISVSGGTDKTTHFFSAGYEKNEGYVVNSGFEKITSRLKVDTEISKTFKAGMSMGYTHSVQNYLDGYTGGNTYSSPFFWTRSIAPIYPVYAYDNDGNQVFNDQGNPIFDDGTGIGGTNPNVPVRPYGAIQHPYATAINDVKEYKTDNLVASGYLDMRLYDGLNLTYTVTGDLFAYGDRSLDTPLYGDAAGEVGGRVSYTSSRRFAFTQQQLLKYIKVFGNHGIDFLLGHETFDRRTDIVSASRSKLFLPDSPYVNHAQVLQGNMGYGGAYALEGFFTRINYDYKNKYFINASARRDASSNFHPDNRWGTFYGLGAAWRISQESFMQNVSWVNELKLKTSYGEQGNDDLLRTLPYLNLYEIPATTDSSLPLQFFPVALGNKDITWETNVNFNVGFETSLFNRRLNVEVEYFERRISDALYNAPLSAILGSGFTRPENNGELNNTGVEATINVDVVRGKDFNLSFSLNATHYKNEIIDLPDGPGIGDRQPNGIFLRQEGYSQYDYYMRDFAGVNPATGAALWWTDGITTPAGTQAEKLMLTEDFASADSYIIGKSAIPDINGGFAFNADFKGFDLGVQFAYQMGGYGYDGVWMSSLAPDRGSNFHRDVADTWTADNPTAQLPISIIGDTNNQYGASSLGLVKSDYLSIQNVSFGYTLNSKFVESLGLSSLRFYGLMDNVHLWSKRQGFDPRMNNVDGGSDNNYSLLRTTSFGINVQF